MVGDKDPFGYPVLTYVWVVGLACAGGIVKYINSAKRFSVAILIRDIITSGFAGLIAFWLCEWTNTTGPLMGVLIGVTGVMGNRVWKEFERIIKRRLGIEDDEGGSHSKSKSESNSNANTTIIINTDHPSSINQQSSETE